MPSENEEAAPRVTGIGGLDQSTIASRTSLPHPPTIANSNHARAHHRQGGGLIYGAVLSFLDAADKERFDATVLDTLDAYVAPGGVR